MSSYNEIKEEILKQLKKEPWYTVQWVADNLTAIILKTHKDFPDYNWKQLTSIAVDQWRQFGKPIDISPKGSSFESLINSIYDICDD